MSSFFIRHYKLFLTIAFLDEIVTDTADIDFSIFDGINLNTEDNSPEQPQQHQSPENPPLSKNVGNSKDDISTTAAPQPSASASATSLEDLAMTHFGQIMCL